MYVDYPPSRPLRAAHHGGANYQAEANGEIVVLVMTETKEGLANLDAICATPALDAVYIGPADLSQEASTSGIMRFQTNALAPKPWSKTKGRSPLPPRATQIPRFRDLSPVHRQIIVSRPFQNVSGLRPARLAGGGPGRRAERREEAPPLH